jgi:hypothetical protein
MEFQEGAYANTAANPYSTFTGKLLVLFLGRKASLLG